MIGNYFISGDRPEKVGKYSFHYSYQGSETYTLMDSYDYLLMGKGFVLVVREDGTALMHSVTGVCDYTGLSDDELSNRINNVITPRALLEKQKLTIGRYDMYMLDELEKTIAKGTAYIIDADKGDVAAFALSPLRGYDKDVAKGLAMLDGEEGIFCDVVRKVLRSMGDQLIGYSAKPVISLRPDMPMYDVMGGIYTHLLYVMGMNTEGIIDDVDIEFLHDFRVSVRRTRSALALVRGVFDKQIEKEFRARFKLLGSLTGLARDMDVYLDRMDEYERMLPEWLKGGMDELRVHFEKTREAEYKKLADYLRSGEFAKLSDDWAKVVGSDKYATEKGKKNVLGIAKKAIWQAFCEIERQAVGMNKDTHSDAVHEIRISFKKIRYLLEFYSSLFDKSKTAPMLKEMKALQDSLGDHNDYYVQQLMLEDLVESGKWSQQTASACGFLTAVLSERQASEREKALKLIIAFMQYKPLFGELFK